MDTSNLIKIYIRSQTAESGPPLSTVLGNLGINTVKFCKDFNDYTKELPNYMKLVVKITVSNNRFYSFSVSMPSTGSIIALLKDERNGVRVNQLCMLAKLKFPYLALEQSFKIIMGSVGSSRVRVYRKRRRPI